jgi:hypothetical protein
MVEPDSGGGAHRWWALAMDSSGREGDPVAPRWRGEGGEM